MSSPKINRPQQDQFDRLARISASTVAAPIALISVRDAKRLKLLGSCGIYVEDPMDAMFLARSMSTGRTPRQSRAIEFIPNVASWDDVLRLPLLQFAPFVRKLLYVPIPVKDATIQAVLTIGQPAVRWPIAPNLNTALSELAGFIGQQIDSTSQIYTPPLGRTRRPSSLTTGQFEESGAGAYGALEPCDTAGDFLLATLNSRTAVRSRRGVSYVVLRTWSTKIKDHQLQALEIVKRRRSPTLIDRIAREIIRSLERLISVKSLTAVVPVPCGHSKGESCLSVDLASEIARQLGVPFSDVLKQPRRSGKSHPRRSAALSEPELVEGARLGNILLVDDVATSGRHIELAIKRLEPISEHVAAVAWIGA